MSESEILPSFKELGLPDALLKAVESVGYETPSPIQAATIPHLLEGCDLLGSAQTGTGKTAAFALPLLSRIDLKAKDPQVLVLAPTRELAIQVAEAFQTYSRYLPKFHVLPIYGGQAYDGQLRQLRRGVHVVVGTPGRVMDHIRKGTLKLDGLKALVLDEADEMLRMGFIDDVEWVMEKTPPTRQIALFSATMPREVARVAKRFLNDPKEVKIDVRTTTAKTINQRYWRVSGVHKLDALTRILESETFDGMILFVRTKTATVELAEKLNARGYAASALNGDIAQAQRERTVDRLKKGKLDILVATDVAARGLDVERISHVVNYDIPYDAEAYVHRIGRTGRAGRSGEAILFVASREMRMLRAIEKTTGQSIPLMQLPSVADVNQQRVGRFKQKVVDAVASEDLSFFEGLVSEIQQEHALEPTKIAAALAYLNQGDEPLLLTENARKREHGRDRDAGDRGRGADRGGRERSARRERGGEGQRDRNDDGFKERPRRKSSSQGGEAKPLKDHPDVKLDRYRLAVGHDHDVKPGNIVGAIANEAGIDSEFIGHIDIYDDHSTVDLPAGMPGELLKKLKAVWVCGQRLDISRSGGKAPKSEGGEKKDSSSKPAEKKKKSAKDKKKAAGVKKKKKPRAAD